MRGAGRAAFALAALVAAAIIVWYMHPQMLPNSRAVRQRAESAAAASAQSNLASPGQSYSYNFDLMARVISAEAKGEPYVGQVAVGAVILNRVDHPNFPKTIPGVIFEPDAFTAVSTGHIWESPAASSVRAAQDALAGWDPSGGAIYYYNPAKATNWWVAGRQFLVQIGRHIFLR